jgi:DNA repair protein RecN (Recombination protein N)
VSGHLRDLAMPHATVEIDVESGPATDDGHDQVTYLLAANPGEHARPLAKAASGGELSRAMLAARVVLSEAPPTLVFDEVDAGIGGEAGAAVGRLLQALGTRHQVLCVTHLAQVAAFAGTQVVVEKAVERVDRAERTVAHATVVDGDERVAELSRMLAGVGDSSHARRHAAELLETASAGAPRRKRPV